jgi:hypothetical protein
MSIAQIVSLINSNPAFVGRAMVLLLSYQTEGERATGSTIEQNGIGFSGATDVNGTYFAKWVLGLPQRTDTKHMGAAIRRFLASDQPGRALTGRFLERGREIAYTHRKQLFPLLPSDPYDAEPLTVRYGESASY